VAPTDTIWELDGHTLAKHRILRVYLEAWIPIMSKFNGRLVIVDGFAGPGVYKGGEPGSPIIMLEAFLTHSARSRIDAELVYLFIESNPARVEELRRQVDRLGELPANVKVEIREGEYQDVFSDVLDTLDGKHLAPTFAFIDPFGYSDAPMSLSGRFLQFRRCEVLIYVPLRFINRFLELPEQESALNALYGGDSWKEAIPLRGTERIRKLHDLFKESLEAAGLKFVRSFEIITKNGRTGYHLFFGTRHELGLERMKEAMWKVDPAEGQRFRDSTNADALVLFEPEPDIRPLRDAIIERFSGMDSFSIEDVLRFVLVETPFLPRHVKKQILKPLEDAGDLEAVDPPLGRRKGTYRGGTRLRLTRT
jgi:three-Cys-motif partner protein